MIPFLKSFVYAFKGIAYGILNERNMRFHFCVLIYMFFFLLRYDFFVVSRTEAAILLLACALVIAAEYVNTAIERAVNLAAKGEVSENAKRAKDTAAGAVLIAAVFAVVIGLVILFQPSAFSAMYAYFAANIAKLFLLLLSLVVAVAFIFVDPSTYLKKFRR